MNRYKKYKPSGINWIGEIPSHWNLRRIKYEVNYEKGKNPKEVNFDGKGRPYLSMEYLRGNPKQTFYVEDFENYFNVEKNEILLLWDGSNAGEFIESKEGVLSSTMAVLNIHSNETKYSWYFFKTFEKNLKDSTIGMGIPHVNGEEFKNQYFILPPKEEQTAIANFLDEKTAKIDKLISNKQILIELLKEEWTAIINEAVSGKGKNWERKKLKYVANIVLGKMLTNEDKGDFFLKPYLRAANMQWLTVDVSNVKEMWFSSNELVKLRIKKDDLLVSEGGEVGRTCIWQDELEECYIQNSVHKISFNKNLNPYFFLYYFFYLGSIGYFESVVNKISIGHLTCEKLNEVSVSYPNLKEQTALVKQIQTESQRIVNIISKIEKEIELMQEYRTALISEVVTGIIKIT